MPGHGAGRLGHGSGRILLVVMSATSVETPHMMIVRISFAIPGQGLIRREIGMFRRRRIRVGRLRAPPFEVVRQSVHPGLFIMIILAGRPIGASLQTILIAIRCCVRPVSHGGPRIDLATQRNPATPLQTQRARAKLVTAATVWRTPRSSPLIRDRGSAGPTIAFLGFTGELRRSGPAGAAAQEQDACSVLATQLVIVHLRGPRMPSPLIVVPTTVPVNESVLRTGAPSMYSPVTPKLFGPSSFISQYS